MAGFLKKLVGGRTGHIAKVWGYKSQSALHVPPVIADIDGNGRPEVLLATERGELIVLDSKAQELWRYSIHEDMGAVEEMFLDQEVMNSINAPPVVAELGHGRKNIIFGSEAGLLYCLDEKGSLLWKFKTGSGIRGSALVADVDDDGRPEIVFGTTDNYLYLLDAHGKQRERFEQASPIESTPGYHAGRIVFGTNDGTIVSITAKGEPKWSFKTGGKVTAEPVFSTLGGDVDHVIIGSEDNNLYCLDAEGELNWAYRTGGAIYSKATVADLDGDGKLEIVIGSCDNNIHAITHEGDRLWTYETDFWVVSTPLVMDIDGDGKQEIVAGSYDHNVYVLDSRGAYILDYMPGISGIVNQSGHYSDIMTQEPGQHVGKRIWQFKTEGVVVGCASFGDHKGLVVSTKKGIVDGLEHKA